MSPPPPYTILNLILFSDTCPAFLKMRDIQRSYLSVVPHLTYYFYCYRENQAEDAVIEGDTLYVKGKETYVPGILEKTLAAMDFLKSRPFQYFLRTNISTLVDIGAVRRRIHTYKMKGIPITYAGPSVILNHLAPYSGKTPFVRGIFILMPRTIFEQVLEHKALVCRDLVDDVALGVFMKDQGIPHQSWPDSLIENPPTFTNTVCFVYRHKTEDRQGDVLVMQRTARYLRAIQLRANVCS